MPPRWARISQKRRTASRPGLAGDHRLVLGEAALAVGARPVVHGVQRGIPAPWRHGAVGPGRLLLVVVREVEQLHEAVVEGPRGHVDRHRGAEALGGEPGRCLLGLGPVAAHQDAATEAGPGGEGVDPGDGLIPVGGALEAVEELVEVRDPPVLAPDPGRGQPLHAEADLEDVAGEAHAAQRGEEQLGVLLARALDDVAARHAQLERHDVLADRAGHVVVLAVDVARDHAAQGDEPGARRDGDEPVLGQEGVGEGLKADAGLGAEHACVAIEGEEAVGQAGADDLAHAAGRQGGIAVGATQTPAEDGALGEGLEVFAEALARAGTQSTPAPDDVVGAQLDRGIGAGAVHLAWSSRSVRDRRVPTDVDPPEAGVAWSLGRGITP